MIGFRRRRPDLAGVENARAFGLLLALCDAAPGHVIRRLVFDLRPVRFRLSGRDRHLVSAGQCERAAVLHRPSG